MLDPDDDIVFTHNVTFAWTSPYGGQYTLRAREVPDVAMAATLLEDLTGEPVRLL